MAHLKRLTIRNGTYYYIVQSVRRKGKVTTKTLEYLGRDPDPKRLKRALRYWGVRPKTAKRSNRKTRR